MSDLKSVGIKCEKTNKGFAYESTGESKNLENINVHFKCSYEW